MNDMMTRRLTETSSTPSKAVQSVPCPIAAQPPHDSKSVLTLTHSQAVFLPVWMGQANQFSGQILAEVWSRFLAEVGQVWPLGRQAPLQRKKPLSQPKLHPPGWVPVHRGKELAG